jgi:hypothetical protein
MEKRGTLTKGLAVIGAALVWFPVLATILTAAPRLMRRGVFQIDYLMPAELFPFALVGGGLLMWAALRAHSRRGLIAWGLALAVGALVAGQVLAVITGLASGETEPTGLWWALVVASLVIYTCTLVEIGTAGVLLVRDVFGRSIEDKGLPAPSG